jgi:hypothetical protein
MVLNVVGKVVRHARRMLLRLANAAHLALLSLLRTKIRTFQVVLSGDRGWSPLLFPGLRV